MTLTEKQTIEQEAEEVYPAPPKDKAYMYTEKYLLKRIGYIAGRSAASAEIAELKEEVKKLKQYEPKVGMEKIKISEQERELVSVFMGEEYPAEIDFNWLMPVVEKISDYHYPDYFSHRPKSHERETYEDCAYPRTFGMRDKEGNYMIRFNANILHFGKTLIEATWKAVVDFIQDYNLQTPKK